MFPIPILRARRGSLLPVVWPAALLIAACAARPPAEPAAPAAEAAPEPPAAERYRVPVDPEAIYHVLAGERLGAAQDLAGAAVEYTQAAQKSRDPEIAERASRIAYAAHAWPEMNAATGRWLELEPERHEALQFRALAQIQTGQLSGALGTLNRLLAGHRQPAEGWALIGALLDAVDDATRRDEVAAALSDLHRGETRPDSLYGQSILAFRLGDAAAAHDLAERAARDTDDLEILQWAAQLAHRGGDDAAALAHYQHALKIDPAARSVILAAAELLRRQGENDAARQLLLRLPRDSTAWYTMALYALAAGEGDTARADYRHLRRLEDEPGGLPEPLRFDHYFYCGRLAEQLDLLADAGDCYRRVQAGPQATAAQLRLAIVTAKQGALETALAALHEAQKSGGDELAIGAYLTEAELLGDAGRPDAALARLSAALAALGGDHQLLYARALLADAAGDLALAEQDLRRIIQEDPENAAALNALGYTLANRTNRHQEALKLIERALDLNPGDPATLDSMGWVQYRLGNLALAEHYLTRALAGERNAEIAAHLGEVLWQLNRRDEARGYFEAAAALDADHPVLREALERLGVERQ